MKLLAKGFEESFWKYSSYDEIHVILINYDKLLDDKREYTNTNLMNIIAENIFKRNNFHSPNEIIVALKHYFTQKNAILLLLMDNFKGNDLHKAAQHAAANLKRYSKHFTCIISSNMNETHIASKGLEEGRIERFNYTIRIPGLSLTEAKDFIFIRLCYGLNRTNVQINDLFSDNGIYKAWEVSDGNPWYLNSILKLAYDHAIKRNSQLVTLDDFENVIKLVSPESEDKLGKSASKRAFDNFPYRERQVCQYLIDKDATAKEITLDLYGELPSKEYRSKYMGTKSFLKRLKDKNAVVVKGQKGRSLVFGLSSHIKELLSEFSDKEDSSLFDEPELYAT